MPDDIVNVRYMVDDVEKSVDFYTRLLDFAVVMSAAPAFADVRRGNLRLLISGPKSSAGRPMSDGQTPGPGGWNRIHFIVDDIEAEVARLREAGATFRNDIVVGPGRLTDPARGPLRELRRALPTGGPLTRRLSVTRIRLRFPRCRRGGVRPRGRLGAPSRTRIEWSRWGRRTDKVARAVRSTVQRRFDRRDQTQRRGPGAQSRACRWRRDRDRRVGRGTSA